jgi:hypothetical protein
MSLKYVKFKHNLKRLHTEAEIKKIIMEKIQKIPEFITLKFDPELTLFVCNLIENGVKEKKIKKIDKKQFVMDVLHSLFNFEEDELKQLDTQIEFLHANKKIKVVNVTKKFGVYLYNWVEKQIL